MTDPIAQRVSQRLQSSGLTHQSLADEIGLDKSKLSKSLNGTRAFSSGDLAAISDALEVDIYWLIGGQPSSFSPRYAYRHTFNGDTGGHERPNGPLAGEIEKIILAYQQARLDADHRLARFRASIGTDRYNSAHLPTNYPMVAPASTAVRKLWQAWIDGGNEPVRDIEKFLREHFGIDLVVADVAGDHRANAQAVVVAGSPIIVVERSGTWYSTLFGIFHELAHLVFGAVSWRGESDEDGEAAFEKFANGFAGDILLSRADLRGGSSLPSMSLADLAEFLWDHAIGLGTARIRCRQNRVDEPAAEITQGSITLRWRHVHGDVRASAWAAPSYPSRLIDRHEELVRTGDVPPDTLAWMLQVPVEDLVVKHEPPPLDEDTKGLLDQLGIPA